MEILYIFFGIHTTNVVQLADRIEQRAQLAALWNENMYIEMYLTVELAVIENGQKIRPKWSEWDIKT